MIDTYNTKYNSIGKWTPWSVNGYAFSEQYKKWVSGDDKQDTFAGITLETGYLLNNQQVITDSNVYHGYNFDQYSIAFKGSLTKSDNRDISKVSSVSFDFGIEQLSDTTRAAVVAQAGG